MVQDHGHGPLLASQLIARLQEYIRLAGKDVDVVIYDSGVAGTESWVPPDPILMGHWRNGVAPPGAPTTPFIQLS